MPPQARLLAFWAAAVGLGCLMAVLSYIPTAAAPVGAPTLSGNTTSIGYLVFLFAVIIAGTIGITTGLKSRSKSVFPILILLIVFISSLYVSGLISFRLEAGRYASIAIYLVVAAVYWGLWWLAVKKHRFLNIFTISICCTVIAALGTYLSPFWLFVLLAGLSAWDIIAVLRTKYMQKLVGILAGVSIAPFALVVGGTPELEAKLAGNRDARAWLLGAGDIGIPGAFIAGLAYAGYPYLCLLAFGGAFAGLLADLLIVRRYKVMVPALPLMCLGASAAFIGLLLVV